MKICQGDSATIECGTLEEIQITFAAVRCCGPGNNCLLNGPEICEQSWDYALHLRTEFVQDHCNGKSDCTISIFLYDSNEIATTDSDVCPGLHKFASIEYACASNQYNCLLTLRVPRQ